MSMLIARFPSGKECEAELEALGFKREEVWIKQSGHQPEEAELELHYMKHKPYQFAAFNFWGAGPE